jgi:hypothetical protein
VNPTDNAGSGPASTQPKNRQYRAFVFSPTGDSCWVWRDIWNHLADGGDIDDAAATIGAIAGIGPNEPPTGPQFAELATRFLDRVGGRGWSDCHRSEDLETVSAALLH